VFPGSVESLAGIGGFYQDEVGEGVSKDLAKPSPQQLVVIGDKNSGHGVRVLLFKVWLQRELKGDPGAVGDYRRNGDVAAQGGGPFGHPEETKGARITDRFDADAFSIVFELKEDLIVLGFE
jgi:hypothetical protein